MIFLFAINIFVYVSEVFILSEDSNYVMLRV